MIKLEKEYLNMVKMILEKNVPDKTVWIFGSRLTNRVKRFSDIDLVVISDDEIPWKILYQLKDDFEESDLPYKVDVLDWSTLTGSFKKIIQQRYEIIQHGKHHAAAK